MRLRINIGIKLVKLMWSHIWDCRFEKYYMARFQCITCRPWW